MPILCVLPFIGACTNLTTDPQAALEATLDLQIPSAATEVQVSEAYSAGDDEVWYVRFKAPANVMEVYLQDLDIERTGTGPGDVYDASLTYTVTPPDWWFDGFYESETYTLGNGSPGPGTRIYAYIDEVDDTTWELSMEVSDR